MKKGMLSLVLFVFSFNLYAASAISDSILKHRKAILKLITDLQIKNPSEVLNGSFPSYRDIKKTLKEEIRNAVHEVLNEQIETPKKQVNEGYEFKSKDDGSYGEHIKEHHVDHFEIHHDKDK